MSKDIKDMEFEEALSELERISSLMNEGKLSLRDAAAMYEKGVQLRSHCAKILSDVEMKVSRVAVDADDHVEIVEGEDQ